MRHYPIITVFTTVSYTPVSPVFMQQKILVKVLLPNNYLYLLIENVHTFCRTFTRHTTTMLSPYKISISICASFFHTLTSLFRLAILRITQSMSLLHTHFSKNFTSESSIKYGLSRFIQYGEINASFGWTMYLS